MWDSSGRGISPGKFDGNLIDFGRYEACINIEVAERSLNALSTENGERRKIIFPTFHGKYARVFLEFNMTELYGVVAKIGKKGSSTRKQITTTFHTSENFPNSLKEMWNITFNVPSRDHLTDHNDFRKDFASLNITDVLVQDFILVSIRDTATYFSMILYVILKLFTRLPLLKNKLYFTNVLGTGITKRHYTARYLCSIHLHR